jgi:hypothetical protein
MIDYRGMRPLAAGLSQNANVYTVLLKNPFEI